MDDAALDAAWTRLPTARKRKIISIVVNEDRIGGRSNFGLANLPVELWQRIASHFADDPDSYHAMRASCVRGSIALTDFVNVANKANLEIWVRRLQNRVEAHTGAALHVKLARVFDEKCRYIHFAGLCHPARVCKYTGLILGDDSEPVAPRCYLWDAHPEIFFEPLCGTAMLSYVSRTKKRVPQWNAVRQELLDVFKRGTSSLKTMTSTSKKRLMVRTGWNEGPLRKKQFVP